MTSPKPAIQHLEICNYKQFSKKFYSRLAKYRLNLRISGVINRLCLLLRNGVKSLSPRSSKHPTWTVRIWSRMAEITAGSRVPFSKRRMRSWLLIIVSLLDIFWVFQHKREKMGIDGWFCLYYYTKKPLFPQPLLVGKKRTDLQDFIRLTIRQLN